MLVRVLDRKTVKIENLRIYAFERQGWRRVTDGRAGPRQYRCSCHAPCGFRAFPGVKRLRNLQWSDVMKCWRRALRATGVVPGGKDSTEAWAAMVDDLKKQNRRFRDAGMVTKASPFMLLARLPGPVVRALAHDYPDEFSPTVGARSEDINEHLERTLGDLYINREHGKPIGACTPKGVEAAVLCG